ncbi:hypothetical protein ACFQPG_10925 [Sphingomonas sp. GCM10030256]|uniref:hypothetical protein n=1 Tax=Sphingomonas sp. GCM10030256 TaxID=3273427 RepID=UPI003605D774
MIELLILASLFASPSTKAVRAPSAALKVVSGVRVTAEDWARNQRKVERTIMDEKGREQKIRMIEFE